LASLYAVFSVIKIALNKSGSSEPAEEITAFVAILERKKFRPPQAGKSIKCSLDFSFVTFLLIKQKKSKGHLQDIIAGLVYLS